MALIAIVEDEVAILATLCMEFVAAGHQVETYSDPVIALPKLIFVPPCVLILNGTMPGMHGIDFCLKFRAFCGTPVIFLSASACEIQDQLGRLGMPAEAYVSKPFSTRSLLGLTAQVLAKARHP